MKRIKSAAARLLDPCRLLIGVAKAHRFCKRNPSYKVRYWHCTRTAEIKAVEATHKSKAKPSEMFYRASGEFSARCED